MHDTGRLNLILKGRPPRNEEDSLAVSARLIRRLNLDGANWSDPIPGEADVDAVSEDRVTRGKKLFIQVVRASIDEKFWRSLGREGAAAKSYDAASAALELIEAVRKKASKYATAQRNSLTLVLDGGRTPNHTFTDVHDLFALAHGAECRDFGFSSVWVVGAVDELVARLD